MHKHRRVLDGMTALVTGARRSIESSLFGAVPLRRVGTPEDIGCAVVFLCSAAAGCITGVSLPVDGGLLAASD